MSAKKKPAKKSKCKIPGPMCKDRAEAFMGARAEVLPKFSEVPQERDKQAFELAAKGWTQRRIAKKLKISQPTVHRAIMKYRCWFGSTLPEDREELYGWARFRVAVEERRIFLQHQQELAMEEWHESRKPVAMKRTRIKVDPEGRKLDEMPITDMQVETWMQKRHPTAAHFNAANKRSLELTMLEGGYLGVNKISCDLAMDTDERDRWDRSSKSDKQMIAELQREVAELKAQVAALLVARSAGVARADEPTTNSAQPASAPSARQPVEHPREVSGGETPSESALAVKGRATSCGNATPPRPLTASGTPSVDESRTAPKTPVSNQASLDSQTASPVETAPSGDELDSRPADLEGLNQVNNAGVPAVAGSALAVKGQTTSCGNAAHARPLPASATPQKPPEGGTPTQSCQSPAPTCLSKDEIALRRLQIRRLSTRH